jgi:endopolyphosphatase
MDWLEVQLMEYRERGMQVWLSGHVPPHMGHYFDNCCKLALSTGAVQADAPDLRYGDLALRYQDTIVGHLYGHM